MISVDTILLLQQKVESAVQKIEQLKSENDALRAERSELTKALSEKSELLSRLNADEKKIEDGILGALSRLDTVENALLDGSQATAQPQVQAAAQSEQAAPAQAEPVTQTSSIAQASPAQQQAPAAQPAPEPQAAPQTEATKVQEPQTSAEQELVSDLFNDDSFETEEEGIGRGGPKLSDPGGRAPRGRGGWGIRVPAPG